MNDPDGSVAPGAPGIPPTWSSSDKDAVGTSHYARRVWFTIGRGILNEVYWPRVDRPQVRDLGFIVADEAGFWSEVKRDATHAVQHEAAGVPAITAVHRNRSNRPLMAATLVKPLQRHFSTPRDMMPRDRCRRSVNPSGHLVSDPVSRSRCCRS